MVGTAHGMYVGMMVGLSLRSDEQPACPCADRKRRSVDAPASLGLLLDDGAGLLEQQQQTGMGPSLSLHLHLHQNGWTWKERPRPRLVLTA